MEAGELLEGGMGSKQAADFENAQSSAGGGRAGDKDASGDKAETDTLEPIATFTSTLLSYAEAISSTDSV
ncbi:hypothetical protein FOPG_19980 [Fusarium oxysporum f. sp. conglutinans race 2 54008]|uniref:Uncharacterized protein n=1 Tax=Fusarium oxysporum f. sp. conglutinans race 2 54008 TaxID=1089457 RepID=X0GJB9_FUSOX|nr:hypothetical protein FOPG_19980 [Fusarium oxysporum f. sp. conglutinans race 2 54008]